MRSYAGMLVIAGDSVLMVREPDFFTGVPGWTVPSGTVEEGETPEQTAVRELIEETGCRIGIDDLELISTTTVTFNGGRHSGSWNFTAEVAAGTPLRPADPDRTVTDARWFARDEAIALLAEVAYGPKREPALRYLTVGERGLAWTFELVDPDAEIPSFRWSEPVTG
ncbi:NUDIX hydrolase [Microlunatus sp. GCM10028923]|uniref:NUDIX hydrolase n=1 Tax=Microlunatus sp. GCM10028923 TaxID=3273400 RepID=UPI00361A4AD7